MDRAAAIALLESHHRFPGDHSFHVIVRADEADVAAVSAALAAHRSLPSLEGRVVRVPSSKGNYVSLRAALPCESAEAVLEVYALLGSLPAVVRYL